MSESTRTDKKHRPEPVLVLDAGDANLPLYVQLVRAVVREIRRGRFSPGHRLPSSRRLADALGVHRNTVLGAYCELELEGWIETRPATGTFVCGELPTGRGQRSGRPPKSRPRDREALGFSLPRSPFAPFDPLVAGEAHRMPFPLVGGSPDLRLVPTAALARAYRRAVRSPRALALAYGDAQGHPRAREAVAAMLSATRGLSIAGEDVLITRGSQMAVDLLARALLQPGDRVAVEAWGYRPAWEALKVHGARLVPIPVDADGIRVDRLEQAAARSRIRAVYVTPHHQYPTLATLSASRRLALLEFARRHRIVVIEDDYDHEFHYEGRPVLPLASADEHGVVVYVGTLSKVLAPGLRLGYLVAPQSLVEHATQFRLYLDRQGDHAVEVAVAELIEDGEVQRHAHRMRRIYRARRDAMVDALADRLGSLVSYRIPGGGMALWVEANGGVDVDAWADRARQQGVLVQPGRIFAFNGRPQPFLRIGYASLDEEELCEAVRRLAVAR